jgi:hypothetical protein
VDIVPDLLGDDVAAVRHEADDLSVQPAEDLLLLRERPTGRTLGRIVCPAVGEDDQRHRTQRPCPPRCPHLLDADLLDSRRGPRGPSRDRRPERAEHLGEARGELLRGRVDQHEPGDLVRVLVGEELDVEPAEGMPDQHVGAGFAGSGEQGVKVVNDLLSGPRRGRVAATAR